MRKIVTETVNIRSSIDALYKRTENFRFQNGFSNLELVL